MKYYVFCIFLLIYLSYGCWYTKKEHKKSQSNISEKEDQCFCQLKGVIDDCSCSVETIDSFNNFKVFPRISSLLSKDYFRYWKVNLNKGCPFWEDDSKCTIRYCSVQECSSVPLAVDFGEIFKDNKYISQESSMNVEQDCDKEGDLGYLNTTISEKSKANFERWAAHDSAQEDSFCLLDDESSGQSRYVDLLLNPERYTGYIGPSAHRVWKTIYQENCFKPSFSAEKTYSELSGVGGQDYLNGMCLEKRAFYRAISGLHTSINVHLCAKYLISEKAVGFMNNPEGTWDHNIEEFKRRFDPVLTEGAGANRLKNLYFLYLLELRALAKVAPYFENIQFYTGNEKEDKETKTAIMNLLTIIQSFPEHFNETSMFGESVQAQKLKTQFRDHFRNVSRIMDCVGCDKCRLWGKLQVTGLGTALKILFSGKFDSGSITKKMNFTLTRNEIVALINGFGKLSESIIEIDHFRRLLQTAYH